MKRILITGKSSYLGNALENWLLKKSGDYLIEKISLRDGDWINKDFSQFDSVLHFAGIAHNSSNEKHKEIYYKVNRDLTEKIAIKCKKEGVKQFVYMSSIIVYANNERKSNFITNNDIPKPSGVYGKSKLEAEERIKLLEDKSFKVAIIRPPMIYGKNSKGNYPKLSKLARHTPYFPNISNQRSMLHIDNFCEFMRLIIKNNENGIFIPQNAQYVDTRILVQSIAKVHGKDIKLIKVFNPVLVPLISKVGALNKVFGDLKVDLEMSEYKEDYRVNDFKTSIKKTEGC